METRAQRGGVFFKLWGETMGNSNKGSALVWVGLAVTHALFTAVAEAQSVSFIARPDFAAGIFRVSVAVGDFNGHGAIDLAVANTPSNSVSVLLGNGDGSFQAARSFGAGSAPL